MGERYDAAREAMGQRVDAAREAMGERATAAREAAGERVDAARDAAAEAIAAVKPRLRGVSHEWAFFVSLLLGAGLVVTADTSRATLAVAIYAVSLSALFGTSALYHRVNWERPNVRRWMRRLDHSMIFLLIAGTYTPFGLLVLDGGFAKALLVAVWAGAVAGIVVEMIWIEAPKWVGAIVYLAVGWVGAAAAPQIIEQAGIGAFALIAVGGLLYTAGAIVYATQRPNPNPAVFGYHEIFHLFVIAAAAVHFAAVAFYALPAS
jgi:hemolysin III